MRTGNSSPKKMIADKLSKKDEKFIDLMIEFDKLDEKNKKQLLVNDIFQELNQFSKINKIQKESKTNFTPA